MFGHCLEYEFELAERSVIQIASIDAQVKDGMLTEDQAKAKKSEIQVEQKAAAARRNAMAESNERSESALEVANVDLEEEKKEVSQLDSDHLDHSDHESEEESAGEKRTVLAPNTVMIDTRAKK